ncbi:MAG: HlyD family type I secretion periplasmic adaptor subunit [Pseudomonadota bacterium]
MSEGLKPSAISELDAWADRDEDGLRTRVRDDGTIRWQSATTTDSSAIIRFGFWSVCILMMGFLIWAMTFPLASAVVTPGTFVSEGRNKLIQHPSGGTVRTIHVQEGQSVAVGDAVVTLDTTKSQGELTRLEARHASLVALRARLDAERSEGLRGMPAPVAKNLTKPMRLRGSKDRFGEGLRLSSLRAGGDLDPMTTASVKPAPKKPSLMEEQRTAFDKGQAVLKEELAGIKQKILTLSKQREGLLARLEAQQALMAMTASELERLAPLRRDGYVARSRIYDKERSLLETQGAVKALELDVLGLDTQIDEMRIRMRRVKADAASTAAQEYTKIVGELAEISDLLVAARSAVSSAVVRAPEAGVITRMNVATQGGVVGAADPIGELVPAGSALVVQARVAPGDIDYVQRGQDADIAVTAFNRRLDDMLTGRVIYKAADAATDKKTGDPYFTVRLAIDGTKGQGRDRRADIQAGMQAEVYIHTGERTFLTYLVKPMIESFRRAFREQ